MCTRAHSGQKNPHPHTQLVLIIIIKFHCDPRYTNTSPLSAPTTTTSTSTTRTRTRLFGTHYERTARHTHTHTRHKTRVIWIRTQIRVGFLRPARVRFNRPTKCRSYVYAWERFLYAGMCGWLVGGLGEGGLLVATHPEMAEAVIHSSCRTCLVKCVQSLTAQVYSSPKMHAFKCVCVYLMGPGEDCNRFVERHNNLVPRRPGGPIEQLNAFRDTAQLCETIHYNLNAGRRV